MQRHFDQELKTLKEKLLKMAALTEGAIRLSIEALKNKDKELAKGVIKADSEIDKIELEIEEKSIELLATRQPVAIDLRFLTTGMKINSELERIADLAVNVCQRVFQIADQPLVKPLIDIPKLADLARQMVKETIDAFVNKDKALAKKVILSDSQADKLRNAVYYELVDDYIVKDGSCGPRAVPLILISRHLERICDHATYIAEDTIYMIDAKIVKHHPEKLKNNKENQQ
ncbi:MAG: phosphate signaling complex protein PhoU [Candidatus Omnitrophica bacterium]|nr:phosphate signaling complex protein PhoU [Candidatus Omnitrophota bacterium]